MNKTPTIVLVAKANQPLVQSTGGHLVTEEFFDNDRRVNSNAGAPFAFYDFINGEPYSKWY